ncbi:MAG: adenylate/guanylate cyclase domain-containing protein [Candidatus Goldbacteria bacterium]|nr:adenylate/guanylate cyclase domain-containing protein [Candidatus Goldiibacteriota bacterium]
MKKEAKAVKKEKKQTFHRRAIIFIGLLATILSIFITRTGFFEGLENKSIDWRFKERGIVQPTAPVVIVAIDDSSFSEMPERWIWPRNFYAQLISNLKSWGAKVIAFDVVYSEPTARNPKEDAEFAKAVDKAGNVVLGMAILYEETKVGDKTTKVFPIPALKDGAYASGIVHHPFDRDSSIRHSQLVKVESETGEKYLSLSMESLGLYKGLRRNNLEIIKEENKVIWGEINSTNQIIINYAGPAGTFTTVPFYQVYYGKNIKKNMFKDKIVLVGSTADILHDVFSTPFSESGYSMPGVEIHANVINTLYNNSMMKRMGRFNGLALLFAIGLFTSFMIFRIKTLRGLIVVFVEVIAFIFLSRYLFDAHNYIIDLVNPLFTMVLCYSSISVYKVAVEEKENRKIKNIFSRYVSKTLVDEILKKQEIKLGGEVKEVSVLFSDIRGFTAMSEKMQPEEVLGVLNEYLTAMTDIVFENGGTLDKFIGDAVMAVFGSPLYDKDHAIRAVRTGWQMQKKLDELNEKWAQEGKKTLKIGVGVNSGKVVAGNMGSMRRMEYTVIGDTVNLASRLESLNKELSTSFLISENTHALVRDRIKSKMYTDIKIKGKEDHLVVYEVLEVL